MRILFIKIATSCPFQNSRPRSDYRSKLYSCGWPQGWHAQPSRGSSRCIQKLRPKHGRSWLLVYAISRNTLQLAVTFDFSRPLFVAFCQDSHRPWRSETESLVVDLKVLCRYFEVRKIIKWKCWRYVKLMFTAG